MQVTQQNGWRHYVLQVASAARGASGRTDLRLKDVPEWLAPTFVGFKSFVPVTLENALELMDEPGEWYLDRAAGRLHYRPRPGERIEDFAAIVPVIERLVEIRGAHDLGFEGLVFAEAGWHGPNQEGWFGYDPGHIVRGGGTAHGVSFANVYASGVERLRVHRCLFTRLGGVGLHVDEGCEVEIVGNVFEDISADGLALGGVTNPGAAPEKVTVANNLFHRTNREFRMGAALLAGKLLDASIRHNYVRDVPYIGIIVDKLFGPPPPRFGRIDVRANRIEEVMKGTFDGGAFYTWYDASSDGARCVVAENHIRGVFSRDSQGIYLDNDCRSWIVERNVIEDARANWYLIKGTGHVLRDNYTTTAKSRRMDLIAPSNIVEEGTTVVPDANWSAHPAARAVVEKAGLEPAYRDLLARLPKPGANAAPEVDAGVAVSVGLLDTLCLRGVVRDDGRPFGILNHVWSKVSGPGEVTFYGQQTRARELPAAFSAPGEYVLALTATDGEQEGRAEVRVTVTPADKGPDLAAGLPAGAYTASAVNTPGEAVEKAFDGNPGSNWYPGFPGTGWLQVDLGKPRALARVELVLRPDPRDEHALSRAEFEIVASNDPEFRTFETIAEQGADPDPQQGGVWTANAPSGTTARYVRWWKRHGFDGVVNELRIHGH